MKYNIIQGTGPSNWRLRGSEVKSSLPFSCIIWLRILKDSTSIRLILFSPKRILLNSKTKKALLHLFFNNMFCCQISKSRSYRNRILDWRRTCTRGLHRDHVNLFFNILEFFYIDDIMSVSDIFKTSFSDILSVGFSI